MADADKGAEVEKEEFLYDTIHECTLLSHTPMGMPLMPTGMTHYELIKKLLRKHDGWHSDRPDRCETSIDLMFYAESFALNFFHDYAEALCPRLLTRSDGVVQCITPTI